MKRILVIALLAAAAAIASCSNESVREEPIYPGAQVVSLARIRFDDGDTFFVDGRPIRVLGVDTPEIRHPDVGIPIDQPYGVAAAESTRALLTRAHRIEIARDGKDVYGRTLAHVFVDGRLLSVRLIEMGLGYETVSHFGDNGFPDLADRILRAAAHRPKPPFEEPYLWRREHQKRR